MPANADRLTSQLANVADIVGDLGLNIAQAQKELNAGYLDSLGVLVNLIKDLKDLGEKQAAVKILQALAPPRYQYTETVLDFSADLSESRESGMVVGGTAAFSAVVVNAGMTIGHGYDYRAAARVTTTLHAYDDPTMADKLLQRSAKIQAAAAEIPDMKDLDSALYDKALKVIAALGEGGDAKAPGHPEIDEQ